MEQTVPAHWDKMRFRVYVLLAGMAAAISSIPVLLMFNARAFGAALAATGGALVLAALILEIVETEREQWKI